MEDAPDPIDGTAQLSDLSLSGVSAIGDDTTDSFGRRMREHALLDKQRMQDATDGVPFRKARPTPGVALTMENLERNNANGELRQEAAARRSSHSLSDSDRSSGHNIPSQWGRKGKQRNDFLKRIRAVSPPQPSSPEKSKDPDTIFPRRTTFTGDSPRSDVDWTATAADIPLPSVEDDESPIRPVSQGRTGSSAFRNSTLDRILELEKEDALEPTANQGHIRRQSTQERRLKEIEDLNRRAVATSRLGQLNGDENSKQHIRRRTSPQSLLRQLSRTTSASPSPQSRDKVAPTTPVVTGAWPQTPATQAARMKPLPTPPDDVDTDELPPKIRRASAPAQALYHPRSALEAILRDARGTGPMVPSTDQANGLGDSTIASLRELVGDDFDGSLNVDDETLDLVRDVNLPLTPDTQRKEEALTLQRMNSFLRSARSGLRDASKGMRRVERSVEAVEAHSQLQEGEACPRCGCRGTPQGFVSRQFYTWPRRGTLKLSWLGILALMFLIWCFLETKLCFDYCPEEGNVYMDGWGVDDTPPEPPFVTLTILTRPLEYLAPWAYFPTRRILFDLLNLIAPVGHLVLDNFWYHDYNPSPRWNRSPIQFRLG